MERRTFIQVVAGASVACGLLGFSAVQNWFLLTGGNDLIGPRLIGGLRAEPDGSDYALYYDDRLVFRVNEPGGHLLNLADGVTPFEKIMARADLGEPEDIAYFFIALGEAGYLEQHVQVSLVEARV